MSSVLKKADKINLSLSLSASLINQNGIELTCQWAHLALIMSLMGTKMLDNMAHLQYLPR